MSKRNRKQWAETVRLDFVVAAHVRRYSESFYGSGVIAEVTVLRCDSITQRDVEIEVDGWHWKVGARVSFSAIGLA